jgi:hypothetical protein
VVQPESSLCLPERCSSEIDRHKTSRNWITMTGDDGKIALLVCNSNAEKLQQSATRQKWEDLEVSTLDSQGNPVKTDYYGYDQLLTCQR